MIADNRTEAQRLREEAQLYIEHAQLLEWHERAEQARIANPDDEDAKAEHHRAQEAIFAFRSAWRGIGEAAGRRNLVSVENNVAEEG